MPRQRNLKKHRDYMREYMRQYRAEDLARTNEARTAKGLPPLVKGKRTTKRHPAERREYLRKYMRAWRANQLRVVTNHTYSKPSQ